MLRVFQTISKEKTEGWCVLSKLVDHNLIISTLIFLQSSWYTGRPVKVYGELIEYLMEKNEDIKALVMDFEGKNIMLYWLAGRTPAQNPEDVIPQFTLGVATPAHWWALSNQGSACNCNCDCRHPERATG